MQNSTRSKLIDNATALVRRRGYAAFSYADLATAVGIRKPSIHHHFPAKEDLGVALVSAYAETFSAQLSQIDIDFPDPFDRIGAFAALYREGLATKQGCLCGVLAAELEALPPRVQFAVKQFFVLNLIWLKRTLNGAEGRLRPDLTPDTAARTVLATLQGALLVALALGDPTAFDQAVKGLVEGLKVSDN